MQRLPGESTRNGAAASPHCCTQQLKRMRPVSVAMRGKRARVHLKVREQGEVGRQCVTHHRFCINMYSCAHSTGAGKVHTVVVTLLEDSGRREGKAVTLLTSCTHVPLAFSQPGCVTCGISCLKDGLSTSLGRKHHSLLTFPKAACSEQVTMAMRLQGHAVGPTSPRLA